MEQVLQVIPYDEGDVMIFSHVCHKALKQDGVHVSHLVSELDNLGRMGVCSEYYLPNG